MKSIAVTLLPRQIDFFRAADREILYSGAFGAGKSRALAYKLVERASRPGAREGLCRKHLVRLRATTLKTLLEPDGALAPVLPPDAYVHLKSEKTIRLRGGGEIVYFGLDQFQKVGSYNLSGCAVDEATELAAEDYDMLRGRLRLDVPGLSNQLYAACNPASPAHFLAQRFGLADAPAAPGCAVVTTRSADNTFLPQAYLDSLQTFTGLAKARYVEGKWVTSDQLVYDRWDRREHVVERSGPWKRVVVGVDEGYSNPACLLTVGVDGDGRLHALAEFYKSKQTQDELIVQALKLNQCYRPEAFLVDPAAASLRAALRARDLRAVPADNEVRPGLMVVQSLLSPGPDKKPRLTVSPWCLNLVREFECYEWLPDRDEPLKENDHALDALRYAVMHLSKKRGGLGR